MDDITSFWLFICRKYVEKYAKSIGITNFSEITEQRSNMWISRQNNYHVRVTFFIYMHLTNI
jgi:hypothetical protein